MLDKENDVLAKLEAYFDERADQARESAKDVELSEKQRINRIAIAEAFSHAAWKVAETRRRGNA